MGKLGNGSTTILRKFIRPKRQFFEKQFHEMTIPGKTIPWNDNFPESTQYSDKTIPQKIVFVELNREKLYIYNPIFTHTPHTANNVNQSVILFSLFVSKNFVLSVNWHSGNCVFFREIVFLGIVVFGELSFSGS